MITIKSFIFNLFATNTYVLSDETGECIIIDPASSKASEEEEIIEYIKKKALVPKAQIITHYHVDHVLGIKFIKDTYGIGATAHSDGKIFWENAEHYGYEYGFNISNILPPEHFITENDIITFGNSEFQVIETPGHAAGSVCLINHQQRFIMVGDVIFYGSIGRTDLPTGDFDLLRDNILNKLFVLNDNYVLYPGHGQKTHIGMERLHNPFVH